MSTVTLKNNLYWQLLRVAINAKHNLMNIAEKHNLTVMQMYTLCLLDEDAAIPMNSLTAMLHCDASNVTGIVDRLFQHKFIKREENPSDRRAKLITLTTKGAKLCEKLTDALNTFQPATFKELSDAEKKQLFTILSKTTLLTSN
ncbi:MAG TPA: MarR family transcriptional regulator [Candidatus Saccharimonadales bacterium]|nr:MarR family transcriptional regulator [Candidatus Saccharimonadales bacterium]